MEFNTILDVKNIISDRKEIIKFLISLLNYVALNEKKNNTTLTYAHREFDSNVTSYEYISNMDQIGINATNLASAKILDYILNYLVTGVEYHLECLFSNYDNEDEEEYVPKSIFQIYEDQISSDNGFLEIQDIPLNKSNNIGKNNFPYKPFSNDFSIPNVCKIWDTEKILQKLI